MQEKSDDIARQRDLIAQQYENEKGIEIGIGLVLGKRYLAENKATLRMDSELCKGTCFIIVF